jgi:hypothetical protein
LQGANGVNTDVNNYVRNVTFNASEQLYKINVVCNQGGECFPKGTAGVVDCPEGTSQSISIQPNKGFKINEVKINGKSVGRRQIHHFFNVQQNHTLEVLFEEGEDYFDLPVDLSVFSAATSVKPKNFKCNEIRIYPNPASSKIYISGLNSQGFIEMYDSLGTKIGKQKITAPKEVITLNGPRKGFCFLKVNDGERCVAAKILIN